MLMRDLCNFLFTIVSMEFYHKPICFLDTMFNICGIFFVVELFLYDLKNKKEIYVSSLKVLTNFQNYFNPQKCPM